MESQDPFNLRSYLEDLVKVSPLEPQPFISKNYTPSMYNSPSPEYRSPSQESLGSSKPHNLTEGGPIPITQPNYFHEACTNKNLHFFVPGSRDLKLLDIEKAGSPWVTVNFMARQDLPSFFKSIITPTGDIYLTGGYESNSPNTQMTTDAEKSIVTATKKIHSITSAR
jgi:hypothetical protein